MEEQQLLQAGQQIIQAAQQGDKQATQIVQAAQQVMQDQNAMQQVQQAAQQGDQQALLILAVIMAGQSSQMARFGAKLNYIKFLRGQCPEGYEMQYFKNGGKAGCKKCQKAQRAKSGRKFNDPVEEFKCGRKMKRKAKCGG